MRSAKVLNCIGQSMILQIITRLLPEQRTLRPKYSKYSGVIVDLYYDHFCPQFDRYSDVPLQQYSEQTYQVLLEYKDFCLKESTIFSFHDRTKLVAQLCKHWRHGRALTGCLSTVSFENKMTNQLPISGNIILPWKWIWPLFPELITFCEFLFLKMQIYLKVKPQSAIWQSGKIARLANQTPMPCSGWKKANELVWSLSLKSFVCLSPKIQLKPWADIQLKCLKSKLLKNLCFKTDWTPRFPRSIYAVFKGYHTQFTEIPPLLLYRLNSQETILARWKIPLVGRKLIVLKPTLLLLNW